MDIAAIDLNLLVAFRALVAERNVTRAGERVGLSQPAMSNALKRLRELFGDPLLTRRHGGMVPTPRALELAPLVHRALAQIESVFSAQPEFEPETSQRTFTVGCTDYAELVVLPELARALAQRAPGVGLKLRWMNLDTALPALRSGAVDLAFAIGRGHHFLPGEFRSSAMFEEQMVCLLRQGHPKVRRRLTLKQYLELSHVLVSFSGDDRGLVDRALDDQGLERRVALTVPSFVAAPLAVARTDWVTTIPKRVASVAARGLPVQEFPVPLCLAVGTASIVWHERTHSLSEHRFLRSLVQELCTKL